MEASTSGTENVRILMVEDDEELCRGWLELFEMFGYEAQCHQRALDALKDKKAILDVNLLITDYYLPDLNGVELIRRMREINPELQAILLTGSREPSVVESVKRLPNCIVMHKPLNIDDLEKEIKSLHPH